MCVCDLMWLIELQNCFDLALLAISPFVGKQQRHEIVYLLTLFRICNQFEHMRKSWILSYSVWLRCKIVWNCYRCRPLPLLFAHCALSLSRKQAATWNCTNGVIVTQIESKLETNWNVECVESGTILLHTLTKQMGDKTNASDMGYSKNNNNRNPFRMRKIMRAEIFEHAIFGWENIRWFSLVRVEENGKFNREWLRHSWDKRKSHWLTLHPERQLQMWEFGTFREGKKCQDLANNCHISGILALFPRFFCHQDWKNTPKVYFLNKSNVEWHISVKRWKFPSLEIFSI